MTPTIIAVTVLALVFITAVVLYNGLVQARMRADEAWSDIAIQLKRRLDLIPNLVNTVKGYATHERETLENLTAARAAAAGATGINQKAEAEAQLSGALGRLFAVAENYPDLKANENFKALQDELIDTEDKIQAARRFYNTCVRDYNTRQQVFPTSLFSRMLGFTHRDFFAIENRAAAEQPVQVNF